MHSLAELVADVDTLFADRDPGLAGWDDPHPDRNPPDEAYSRLTNPARWRILGARADAWIEILVRRGIARDESVDVDALEWLEWRGRPPIATSARAVVPAAERAIPLVVARTRLGDVGDAGVTLGVDRPVTIVDRFPDCGCDACDSGSHDELTRIDDAIGAVITGRFRRLTRGPHSITVGLGAGLSYGGSGPRHLTRAEVETAIADPTGWHDVSGAPWF